MQGIIEKYLKDKWTEIALEDNAPRSLRLLKLSGQHGPNAPLNFILFNESEEDPKYFVKSNRSPEGVKRIEEEFSNLKKVRNELPEGIAQTFPEPIFLGKVDDFTAIMVEKFLPGKKVELNNVSQLKKLYSESFKWLEKFLKVTAEQEIKFDETLNFISKLNDIPKEKLDKLSKRMSKNIVLPVSSSQGDFDFDNIMFNKKDIYIVDWEDYENKSHPFLDVEFLIFNTAMYFYSQENHLGSFNRFFLKDSETFKIADHYLSRYYKFLKLNKDIFYFMSILDTVKIIRNGYKKHNRVPMQSEYFLKSLIDLCLRETE